MIGSPAVDPLGNIYAGSMDHKLYAVTPLGNPLWPPFVTGDFIQYSSPAMRYNRKLCLRV